MAFIGMRHVVVAKVSAHTDGAMPTYAAGMFAGKAISGNLTINRSDNPLRADDAIAEEDSGITGMELELGLDDLPEDVQEYIGLLTKKTTGSGTSAVTKYYDTSAMAFDVGVGYIRVRQKDNVITFQTVWILSAKFGMNSENSQTKGETIEWQTPTVSGRCKGMMIDASGDLFYREKQNFSTYDAAATYLDGLAGISSQTTGNN